MLLEAKHSSICCTGDKEWAVRCDNLFYLPNVPEAMLLDSHFKSSRSRRRSLTFNFPVFAVVRFLYERSRCCVVRKLPDWPHGEHATVFPSEMRLNKILLEERNSNVVVKSLQICKQLEA